MAELTEDQQKLADLTTQVSVLTGEKTALSNQVTALSAEKTALTAQVTALSADKTALSAEKTTLTTAKEAAEKQATDSLQVIADLKQKLADTVAGTVRLPTLKVDKDTYELTSGFFYKNQEITIEVLKGDTELTKEIIKEGIGNLRKVVAVK